MSSNTARAARRLASLLIAGIATTACAGEDRPPAPAVAGAPNADAFTPADVLQGTLADGVGRSLVALRPETDHDAPPPSEPAVIDQFGYTFEPSLLIAQQDQTVRIGNSEDVDHNVRVTNVETRAVVVNANLMMGETVEHRLDRTGPYTVRCDIHPAMMALILVVSHPYATITDTRGAFRIENIPPGAYELTTWSAAGERILERAVSVTEGADGRLEMTSGATD